MGHIVGKTNRLLGALLVSGLSFSCNGSGGAKAPRLSSIPLQSVGGGSTFVLDLSSFVQDDTLTATYTVLSGGGSFTGSVYSQAFPTLGTYTVSFQVSDFRGNTATGSFQVKVTSAELGIVRNGTGVSLLDLQTFNFASALPDDGKTKVFKAALAEGGLVFEASVTGQTDLWLFDPNLAGTDIFAGDSSKNEVYVLKTTDNRILFVEGAAPNRSLHLYEPANKSTVQIASSATPPRDERDAVINKTDRIYFESAANGLADIWYQDAGATKAVLVSSHARDEDIVAVLPDGGLVFRRKGDGGEWDLLYFKGGVGVVEIGTDLGTTKNLESKDYKAATTSSLVVFETTDSGGDQDLYAWNPATGQTTAIAQTGVDETFLAISGSGRILYKIQTAPSNADISWFSPANSTIGVVTASSLDETYRGTLTNGDVIFSQDTGANGKDLFHFDESAGTASPFPGATSTTTDQVFAKVLANDDVVYQTGSDLFFFRHSAGTSTSVTTGAGTETFAAETTGGDFVIRLVSGANTHLYLWDSSAAAAVAVSTVAGTAVYQAVSSAGTILFSRTPSGGTSSELFRFDPATSKTTQVTQNTANDTVDAVIQAAVN